MASGCRTGPTEAVFVDLLRSRYGTSTLFVVPAREARQAGPNRFLGSIKRLQVRPLPMYLGGPVRQPDANGWLHRLSQGLRTRLCIGLDFIECNIPSSQRRESEPIVILYKN